MKRSGSAVWQGDLKSGKGTVSTDSGVLNNQQYSFGTRFENGKGTNPEELIAAAHASCFTMALSAQLGNAGLTPEKFEAAFQRRFLIERCYAPGSTRRLYRFRKRNGS